MGMQSKLFNKLAKLKKITDRVNSLRFSHRGRSLTTAREQI